MSTTICIGGKVPLCYEDLCLDCPGSASDGCCLNGPGPDADDDEYNPDAEGEKENRMSTTICMIGRLTRMEREMLQLLCSGKTDAEIADLRRIKVQTVRTMRSKLKVIFEPDHEYWSDEAFIAYAKEYVLPQYLDGGGQTAN